MVVLLGAAALFAGGCGITFDGGAEARYDYPDEAQENFLNGCEGTSGGETAYCECLLAEFQDTVPFEDFARIDRTILESGLQGLPPEDRELFQSSVDACSDELES